jgi:hypothetical protein
MFNQNNGVGDPMEKFMKCTFFKISSRKYPSNVKMRKNKVYVRFHKIK